MAILINGNGNPAIYPDQDADWFASIFGGQTAITGVGSQFAAEIQDANTIALADGVIITKEGRRIQLDTNQSDIFEIPTGAQGTTNYYIIGYCLTTNDDSSQTAETFVQLMENATDTIDEDTFRGGADKVYVSVYRVTQTGFNLETPELLLPKVESLTQLNSDLSDFKFRVNSGVPEFSIDGGTTWSKLGGSAMFDLDYSNPLHQFDNPTPSQSGHGLTFTATTDCVLKGQILPNWPSDGELSIAGKNVAFCTNNNDGTASRFSTGNVEYKLNSGDVVSTTVALPRLYVYSII